MKVTSSAIEDVKVIEPRLFTDERGFFMETWNARTFAAAGIDAAFVQDNHSVSALGVLRGLHYQIARPQGKLVRVVAGAAFDVAVDIRRASPTFGRWVGVTLTAVNRLQLWIPAGFAHGFLSLTAGTELVYKCSDFYAPEHERTLLWSDPALRIEWPLTGMGTPHLSPKDAAGLALADAETFP